MEGKRRLVAALRVFGRFGFTPGRITLRDGDRVWVNPTEVDLRLVRAADLDLVDVDDPALGLPGLVHAERPDVVSVAQAWSPHGAVWSTLDRTLDPLTQDACAFYVDDGKAMVVPHAGLLTVGRSVDEAAWWFITMERSCQAQLAAEAAGVAVPIEPDVAAATYEATGGHATGERQFRPLYDWITRLHPELLDD